MNIFQALVLGLVQGLTEFIPISSSGHLVLAHHALGVFDHGLAFDIALHFGTLVALVIYFWKDLVMYLKSLFVKSDKTHLTWLLIVATIPAAIIGYLLESKAETTFRSVRLVSFNLLAFGLVMLVAEYYYKRSKKHVELDNISAAQAISMGLAQALAVIPGISRSGSTITAGLFGKLDRVAATRFSFLLGIPITAGAILKVFTEKGVISQIHSQQTVFLVGTLTALISGMLAIRFMLGFIGKHGLYVFAYYRVVLGITLIAVFTLR